MFISIISANRTVNSYRVTYFHVHVNVLHEMHL